MAGVKMNLDEEIFLADNNDSSEIFLADNLPSFYESKSKISPDEQNSYEVDKIYTILKISEKPEKVDFKEYFKSNPEIFKIAGVDYYKTLTSEQYLQFENKCEKLISQAKSIWNSPKQNYKIAELDDALGTLKSIFRNENATKGYISEINRTLNSQMNSFLNQKLKDGILELSEIQELLEIAFSIHLIANSENGKKAILNWIKKTQENKKFKIETYTETFIRKVKDKTTPFERFDTDFCKQKLFNNYKKLAQLNEQIFSEESRKTNDELYKEMYKVLINEQLFIDNVKFYKQNFFEKEKATFKGNFSLPHSDEEYYYYKGTAKNLYQLTEEQWNEFVRLENLKKEDDTSVAFIMGTEKAVTVTSIANLLEANPHMALDRIRAGDVETYLYHIGQIKMSKALSAKKEELKNDSDLLVQTAAALLRGVDLKNKEEEEEINETDSLIPMIERKSSTHEIISYLLRRKQFERLNKKILSIDTQEHIELENYLSSIGMDFQKICLNYLNEFLEENNATVYKNMYETYARYLTETLTEQKDSITFMFVLKPVINKGFEFGLISDIFMKDFSEKEQTMNEILQAEKNTFLESQNRKQKKSFFGFKNK